MGGWAAREGGGVSEGREEAGEGGGISNGGKGRRGGGVCDNKRQRKSEGNKPYK